MSSQARVGLAVLGAGIAGLALYAVASALAIEGAGFWSVVTDPVRIVAAVLGAAMLPPIHRALPRLLEGAAGLAVLTLYGAVVAKWGFGLGAPWTIAFAFNAVYAAAALVAYRFLREWGRAEHD